MANETITRAHLSNSVYQEVGLSRNESTNLVESVLDEIAAALARGEMVKISSFGSFAVRKKQERVGRNPKTGEEVPIASRQVLVFRPSHVLKDRVNNYLTKFRVKLTKKRGASGPLQKSARIVPSAHTRNQRGLS
ncbi:MAG: integration host factor subunit alpha [Candidatus Symbiobacter sp.]|nr:integration host factor subunit alpha [Candidatus Symbiobacter sp.]